MSLSLYDVLDVDPTASAEEIRAAWKSAIADLEPGDRRFRAYNQAAEVLLDPERRADYDAELAAEAEPEAGPEPVVTDEPEPEAQAEPEAEPEPEPEPEPDQDAVREPVAIATWVLAAVGVLAAAVLAVTIVVWARQDDPEPALDTEENASAALDAAEVAAEPVLSYDYRTFSEDIVDAESYMTTSYAAEHSELMSDLQESVAAQKAIVDAQLKGSAIVRVTGDRADILVLVNQVTQKTGSDDFVLPVWATLQMVREDGEWLVDSIVNEGTVGG